MDRSKLPKLYTRLTEYLRIARRVRRYPLQKNSLNTVICNFICLRIRKYSALCLRLRHTLITYELVVSSFIIGFWYRARKSQILYQMKIISVTSLIHLYCVQGDSKCSRVAWHRENTLDLDTHFIIICITSRHNSVRIFVWTHICKLELFRRVFQISKLFDSKNWYIMRVL